MPAPYGGKLPTKRVASGALFLDSQDRVLIVKPNYRPEWLIPGGMVEDFESPAAACQREVKEEIGLDIELGPMLSVEHRSPDDEGTDALHFVFFGGRLTDEQVGEIAPQQEELEEVRFAPLDEARRLLDPPLGRQLVNALEALKTGRPGYSEDGQTLP